jgi:hypothetical protein
VPVSTGENAEVLSGVTQLPPMATPGSIGNESYVGTAWANGGSQETAQPYLASGGYSETSILVGGAVLTYRTDAQGGGEINPIGAGDLAWASSFTAFDDSEQPHKRKKLEGRD